MSEPFIAEVKIFAGNFAPRSWAFCDGQLLPIAQNTALFSLIGTTYGGDGRTTMGLPDLKGRAPMHPGRGPGLTQRRLGQKGGVETVALNLGQMPQHNHAINVVDGVPDQSSPGGASHAQAPIYAPDGANLNANLANSAIANQGGGGAHNNMQPYLVLNFIIALQGLFPSRS